MASGRPCPAPLLTPLRLASCNADHAPCPTSSPVTQQQSDHGLTLAQSPLSLFQQRMEAVSRTSGSHPPDLASLPIPRIGDAGHQTSPSNSCHRIYESSSSNSSSQTVDAAGDLHDDQQLLAPLPSAASPCLVRRAPTASQLPEISVGKCGAAPRVPRLSLSSALLWRAAGDGAAAGRGAAATWRAGGGLSSTANVNTNAAGNVARQSAALTCRASVASLVSGMGGSAATRGLAAQLQRALISAAQNRARADQLEVRTRLRWGTLVCSVLFRSVSY